MAAGVGVVRVVTRECRIHLDVIFGVGGALVWVPPTSPLWLVATI